MPTVSVIVPCRNEEPYIQTCLESILNQDYPAEDVEVLVVDGMSEDGTRGIVTSIARDTPNLRIIDNPYRKTPCAMNRGIEAARGRYVAILGAHTEYGRDYLRACVELLDEHPEVCCVGGPIQSIGSGLFGRAVASVMAHPVGVGNAKHRYPTYEGYAEGACYPVFRKEVFEKIGFYDEHLVRNQDDELNYRLARHGEKVFISPRARCTYSVRETPSGLFRQYFQYGFWRVAVLRKHRLPASIRQVVPPLFISFMLAVTSLGLLLPGWWRLTAAVLPVVYGATLLGVGAGNAGKIGWRVALLFPVAAAIIHAAYAAGFATGLIKGTNRLAEDEPTNKGEYHAARH
jgi:cellulose synthase/poly-beta-1,6-N-acetylglucosamine synthase-like glycosyltransferase